MIEYVDSVRDLDCQTKIIQQKVYGALDSLNPLKHLLPPNIVLIYKQLSDNSPEYLNHMFLLNGESSRYRINFRINF